MKAYKNLIFTLLFILTSSLVYSASLSISLGSYETNVVKGNQITIPVTIQLSSGSGSDNVNVRIEPSSGLSCSTCTDTILFSSDGSQQTSFQISADTSGSYSSPFTITATLNSDSSSKTATNTITVSEPVSWEITLTADKTSSINENDNIELTADVRVTSGTLEGVTADLSIPSSLSLITGVDPYSMGDISGTGSASWTVKAGSFSSTINPSVTITSTNPSDSKSKTVSLTPTTTTTTTSSATTTTSSSTSSGGVLTTVGSNIEKKIVKIFSVINASKKAEVPINDPKIDLLSVNLISKVDLTNIRIEVSSLKSEPSTMNKLNKKTYKFFSISKTGINDEQISEGEIFFKVTKEWLTENKINIDDVLLYRYHNSKWNALTTIKTGEDSIYIYFKANTPGFSFFAISFKTTNTKITTTTNLEVTTTTLKKTNENIVKSNSTETTTTTLRNENNSSSKSNIKTWLSILSLVILIAIIYMIYKKKTEWDV